MSEANESEMELNNCRICGSSDIRIQNYIEKDGTSSQYMAAFCVCGNNGGPSLFFKDCGMEGMSDEEIAAENWNFENQKPVT